MSRKTDDNPLMFRSRKGPSWGKILGITLCVILGIVVAGSAGIYYFGHNMISRMNYKADEDVKQFETLPEKAFEVSTEAEPAGNVLNESELENLHILMNQAQTDQGDDVIMDKSVYNVIIAGVDRDDESWNGNADSVMLVSLNNDQKRASVISLMRDTYVEIPGHDYNKLNSSYAYGGGPLLCDTVEENYRIPVERYAAVDFENLVDIVDDLAQIVEHVIDLHPAHLPAASSTHTTRQININNRNLIVYTPPAKNQGETSPKTGFSSQRDEQTNFDAFLSVSCRIFPEGWKKLLFLRRNLPLFSPILQYHKIKGNGGQDASALRFKGSANTNRGGIFHAQDTAHLQQDRL